MIWIIIGGAVAVFVIGAVLCAIRGRRSSTDETTAYAYMAFVQNM